MTELVTERPKTVCVECRHAFANNMPPDYCHQDYFCHRGPDKDFGTMRVPCPVTGWKFVYIQRPLCRDINHGNCSHYEAKDD